MMSVRKKALALLHMVSSAGLVDPSCTGGGLLTVRADIAEKITALWADIQSSSAKLSHHDRAAVDTAVAELEDQWRLIKVLSAFSLDTSQQLSYFSVKLFPFLEEIILDMVPPSTITDLYQVHPTLKRLVVTNSGMPSLVATLAPFQRKHLKTLSPMILPDSICSIPEKCLWTNLTALQLVNCGITRIDESMHFFPKLQHLDLSRNAICHIVHLQDCIDLRVLDLSHNRIRILSNLERVVGGLRSLSLVGNLIRSIDGLQKIYSLERVDVADNDIDDFAEVQHLCRLPNLSAVLLRGNPIAAEEQSYRMRVFREFIKTGAAAMAQQAHPAFPALDGKDIAESELNRLRRVMFRNASADAYYSHSTVNEGPTTVDDDKEWLLQDGDIADVIATTAEGMMPLGDIDERAAAAAVTVASSFGPALDPRGRSLSVEQTSGGGRPLSMSIPVSMSAGHSYKDSRRPVDDSKLNPAVAKSAAFLRRAGGPLVGRSSGTTRIRRPAFISDARRPPEDEYPDIREIEEELRMTHSHYSHNHITESSLLFPGVGAMPPQDIDSSSSIIIIPPLGTMDDLVSSAAEDSSPEHGPESWGPRSYATSVVGRNRADSDSSHDDDDSAPQPPPPPPAVVVVVAAAGSRAPLHDGSMVPKRSAAVNIARRTPLHHESSQASPHIVHTAADAPIELLRDACATSEGIVISPTVEVSAEDHQCSNSSSSYVGNEEYSSLSVRDNMDLYLREQVFSDKRPSRGPYMLRGGRGGGGSSSPVAAAAADDGRFVSVPVDCKAEKYVAVFHERVIAMDDPPIADPQSSSSSSPLLLLQRKPALAEEDYSREELLRYLILTDATLYIAEAAFAGDCTFAEAPLLAVTHCHPLYSLCKCIIFFGFQRCLLAFAAVEQYDSLIEHGAVANGQGGVVDDDNDDDDEDDHHPHTLKGEVVSHRYMVLPRDKARTYSIIARIPKAANIKRSEFVPIPLPNVQISNNDFQLVQRVMECTASQGTGGGGDLHCDIVHYQMLFQVWRSRPHLKAPRSLVMTKTLLLLCRERLTSSDISIDVIDQALLSDVQKIVVATGAATGGVATAADSPLHVTLVIRPPKVFAAARKWRLCTDSLAASSRLQEECRRACSAAAAGCTV